MLGAPKSVRTHELVAHELEMHGHPAEAIENFRVALKIEP